jgi:hypothetical protein
VQLLDEGGVKIKIPAAIHAGYFCASYFSLKQTGLCFGLLSTNCRASLDRQPRRLSPHIHFHICISTCAFPYGSRRTQTTAKLAGAATISRHPIN